MEILVVLDKKHPNMYRLQWPDGTKSISTPHPDRVNGHYGFYNKTRAKELSRLLEKENVVVDVSYDASQSPIEAR